MGITVPPSPRATLIPFPKNDFFLGRHSDLEKLKEKLFADQTWRKVAIFGLGGIGKTQIALSLAFWVIETQPHISVFWIPAVNTTSVTSAVQTIAQYYNIQATEDSKAETKTLVKRHLSTPQAGRWFIVVDNVDDRDVLDVLEESSPHSDQGRILYTTRSREVADRLAESQVHEVGNLSPDEAMQLLQNRLHTAVSDPRPTIAEFVQEMEFLPLAITQAAAYMNVNTNVSIGKYLRLIRSPDERNMATLLSKEMHDSNRYKNSCSAVATTWVVSFNQIRREHPAALELLRYLSCVGWRAVPHSFLPHVGSGADTDLLTAIGTLCSYAFLSKQAVDHEELFDMHRLVHLASRVWLQQTGCLAKAQTDTETYLSKELVFPRSCCEICWGDSRFIWRTFIPHVMQLRRYSKELDVRIDSAEVLEIYVSIGRCLYFDNRYKEQLEWLQDLHDATHTLSEDDSVRLELKYALAFAYFSRGKMDSFQKWTSRLHIQDIANSSYALSLRMLENFGIQLDISGGNAKHFETACLLICKLIDASTRRLRSASNYYTLAGPLRGGKDVTGQLLKAVYSRGFLRMSSSSRVREGALYSNR
jgi:hypothetical protein